MPGPSDGATSEAEKRPRTLDEVSPGAARRLRTTTAYCPASVLPASYRVELNALLVPFGKHVRTGRLLKVSTCPVLDMCRQVGVGAHR